MLALCTAFTYTAYLVGTDRHVKIDGSADGRDRGSGSEPPLANVVYAFAFNAVVLPAGERLVAAARR